MNRVLFASGGSGGHLAPAIALAQATMSRCGPSQVWISATQKSVDARMKEKYVHLSFISFPSAPLSGGIMKLFWTLPQNIAGIWKAICFLKMHRIEQVFATGGFGCVPPLVAGLLLGLPVFAHESNSIPGKVTRWFRHGFQGLFATRLLNPEFRHWAGLNLTGFPIREDFIRMDQKAAKRIFGLDEARPLITVFGGSQGAKALTVCAEKYASQWWEAGCQVVIVCGPNNYQPVVDEPSQLRVLPFVEDMGTLLSATDILIARSGAGSIAEIATAQCCSILVPLPGSADQHQQHNAANFAEWGCAHVLDQNKLEAVPELVADMLNDRRNISSLQKLNLKRWAAQNRVDNLLRKVMGFGGDLVV